MTSVMTGSMIASVQDGWLKPYKQFIFLNSTGGSLNRELIDRLRGNPSVLGLYGVATGRVRVMGIFGSESRLVVGLSRADMEAFLDRAGFRLVAGRLPRPGQREIVLHELIMKGKGLSLGGEIGKEADDSSLLPGRFRVTGALAGPFPLGVMTRDSVIRSLLVLTRESGREGLEAELARMPRRDVNVIGYSLLFRRFREEVASMDTMIWILNLVTVGTLSLSVGLLHLIFFLQRMPEFGILTAFGFKRRTLIGQAAREITVLTALSWLAGLLLSRFAVFLIEALVYAPRGIALTGIDARTILFTLPIPVMITLFSAATVVWRLGSFDVVSILDRRD